MFENEGDDQHTSKSLAHPHSLATVIVMSTLSERRLESFDQSKDACNHDRGLRLSVILTGFLLLFAVESVCGSFLASLKISQGQPYGTGRQVTTKDFLFEGTQNVERRSDESAHETILKGTSPDPSLRHRLVEAETTKATTSSSETGRSPFAEDQVVTRSMETVNETVGPPDSIERYREKVKGSLARVCHREGSHSVDLGPALSCLRLTTPDLILEYPVDAEEHFYEIRERMAPWAQHDGHHTHWAAKFGGPWIENHWIQRFEGSFDNTTTTDGCLSSYFGGFVPIFLPWTDVWVNHEYQYPDDFVATLLSVLRPTVPYVTVSQNAGGIPGGHSNLSMAIMPNLLVLSAGGLGHVPIPLLKQTEEIQNVIPIQDRSYFATYLGSLSNSPRNLRKRLHEQMRNLSLTYNFTYKTSYGGVNWRTLMTMSRFSLAPRGFGRTSYHLNEILQMGLIPIQVYDDMPWIPYAGRFREVGFSVNLDGLAELVLRLHHMPIEEIKVMEARVGALRQSHFWTDGILTQIGNFLQALPNDLRWQPCPRERRVFRVSTHQLFSPFKQG